MSLNEKLFRIQTQIENPKKTTDGYNWKFAPLDEVLKIVKFFFEKERLLLSQIPKAREEKVGIYTAITCLDSGEKIEAEFLTTPAKTDCQGVGSQLSYYRRYSLLILLNLVAEDCEDDGEATVTRTKGVL